MFLVIFLIGSAGTAGREPIHPEKRHCTWKILFRQRERDGRMDRLPTVIDRANIWCDLLSANIYARRRITGRGEIDREGDTNRTVSGYHPPERSFSIHCNLVRNPREHDQLICWYSLAIVTTGMCYFLFRKPRATYAERVLNQRAFGAETPRGMKGWS